MGNSNSIRRLSIHIQQPQQHVHNYCTWVLWLLQSIWLALVLILSFETDTALLSSLRWRSLQYTFLLGACAYSEGTFCDGSSGIQESCPCCEKIKPHGSSGATSQSSSFRRKLLGARALEHLALRSRNNCKILWWSLMKLPLESVSSPHNSKEKRVH